jgi:peptidoglycan/xylan/chitin deacetylase (PgdA/CDA1 family)
MYHDVVELDRDGGDGESRRFRNRYKLDQTLFERHLAAIAGAGVSPSSIEEVQPGTTGRRPSSLRPLYLTFDDGEASALRVGELLARAGWVGHFFIPTDFIGRPGFLDEVGVAELARMGHVIGSHSCSHSVPMTRLPEERLREEWCRSVAVLSEIIGSPVSSGSVPGGFWSKQVASAAAACGVRVLFTSDPVVSIRESDGCLLLGRYAILAGTSAEVAARLALGELGPRLRRIAWWKTKAVGKAALGDSYWRLRTALLKSV